MNQNIKIANKDLRIKQNILSELDSLILENNILLKKNQIQDANLIRLVTNIKDTERKNQHLVKLIKNKNEVIENLKLNEKAYIKQLKNVNLIRNKHLTEKDKQLIKLEELNSKLSQKLNKIVLEKPKENIQNDNTTKLFEKYRNKIADLIIELQETQTDSNMSEEKLIDLQNETKAFMNITNELKFDNTRLKLNGQKQAQLIKNLTEDNIIKSELIAELESKVGDDSARLRKNYDLKLEESIKDFEEKEIALRMRIDLLEKELINKRNKIDMMQKEQKSVLEMISANIRRIE